MSLHNNRNVVLFTYSAQMEHLCNSCCNRRTVNCPKYKSGDKVYPNKITYNGTDVIRCSNYSSDGKPVRHDKNTTFVFDSYERRFVKKH